jgi:hypothetical protein
MPLKDHNLVSAQSAVPDNWRSQAGFVKYEYGRLHVGRSPAPQEPRTTLGDSQPLKGVSLGASQPALAEERDFRVAYKRRHKKRTGSSLEEIGKKYALD